MSTLADRERAEVGGEVELPRIATPPILFAIARDPRTIFAYWYVDWTSVFQDGPPADRQVYLRVQRNNGEEEMMVAVEPMAGQTYLTVSEPRAVYGVEIGYFAPASGWKSVARSGDVAMPAETIAQNLDVDLATVPFHLSFQRLVDLFRLERGRDALTGIISRLQERALSSDEHESVSADEWEILHAMDLSLDEMRTARSEFATQLGQAALRRRAETLLGFGATSPWREFGSAS